MQLSSAALGVALASLVASCGLDVEGRSEGPSLAPAPSGPGAPSPGDDRPPNAGPDARRETSLGETNVFAGAPPYVATLGPSTIDRSGRGNGHRSFNADGNPAGRACLECHRGGPGRAPEFLFAGTVFADAAGTTPAARVEVRLVGANNKATSVYTDEYGNFFFRAPGNVSAPASAGVRSATRSLTMTNKLNDADCNRCHAAGSRITL